MKRRQEEGCGVRLRLPVSLLSCICRGSTLSGPCRPGMGRYSAASGIRTAVSCLSARSTAVLYGFWDCRSFRVPCRPSLFSCMVAMMEQRTEPGQATKGQKKKRRSVTVVRVRKASTVPPEAWKKGVGSHRRTWICAGFLGRAIRPSWTRCVVGDALFAGLGSLVSVLCSLVSVFSPCSLFLFPFLFCSSFLEVDIMLLPRHTAIVRLSLPR